MPDSSISLAGIGAAAFSERTRQNRLSRIDQKQKETDTRFRQEQADRQFSLQERKLAQDQSSADLNAQLRQLQIDQARGEIDAKKEILQLQDEIVALGGIQNTIQDYEDYISEFDPNTPLAQTSPEFQKRTAEFITRMNDNEISMLFSKDSVIPVEMDEEGNPVFLDVQTLAELSEQTQQALAGRKEKLNLRTGAQDSSKVFATREEPTGTRIVLKNGETAFVPFEKQEQKVIKVRDITGTEHLVTPILNREGVPVGFKELSELSDQEIRSLNLPSSVMNEVKDFLRSRVLKLNALDDPSPTDSFIDQVK